MNVKHVIVAAALSVALFASWANAAESEASQAVTKKADAVAVDRTIAQHAMALVEEGKASYTVTDPDGVKWTVRVAPKRLTAKEREAAEASR